MKAAIVNSGFGFERILFPFLAVAALTVGMAPGAFAQSLAAPRAGTADAMQCLVRQGPKGCEKMFVGSAWTAAQPWVWDDTRRDFNRGALLSSSYWGRASKTNIFDAGVMLRQPTNEMDIFDIKFAHYEYTFYISPADENGKVRGLAIRLYAPHDVNQLSQR